MLERVGGLLRLGCRQMWRNSTFQELSDVLFFVDEPQNMTTVQYLPRRHQRGIDLFDLLLRNTSFKIQIFIDSFLTIFSYYVQFNNCLDFAGI